MIGDMLKFRGRGAARAEVTVGVIMAVAVIALWEGVARAGLIAPQFLPAPSRVVTALWQMTCGPEPALARLDLDAPRLGGLPDRGGHGDPIGILMSSYRIVGAALEPIIDFIRYLPVPALVPLSIIWFGVGETTKIFLLWLGTFFQLVLLVADDTRRVPHEYVEIAFTLGAKPRQVLKDVIFRAMGPTLVDNLRITLAGAGPIWCWPRSWRRIPAWASSSGREALCEDAGGDGGVVVIGLIGLITDQILRAMHRRAFRYV